jgi:hypothetical protein
MEREMSEEVELNFQIASEEDAFSLLERLLHGEISEDEPKAIVFRNWPKIDVYLPRTPLKSSISPTMMEAFIETQTALYRAYMLLTADTADLRGLSGLEKEKLEFRVLVNGGSSEYLAELNKSIETIGSSIVLDSLSDGHKFQLISWQF